ncbi:hypothetical protein DVH24_003551 [Malus domestica]|uniref:Terpene synthase N-terminal domain-containing protein n=1 Tax=Malus domestica TaxID=3750 RepID=A0A498IP96_MALDO|nr:hypothetical protein DVH24_003551 [Malus domestica]
MGYTKLEKDVQELKEKVKRMVMAPSMPSEKLNIINNVSPAVSKMRLRKFCSKFTRAIMKVMAEKTLRFRLVRQQGFKVSCGQFSLCGHDMFNKFKDVHGKFKESLATDAVRLLSLFEAAHVRVHGEDLLDEALTFTTAHLESSIEAHRLSSLLSKQVTHALYQPFRKGFTRLEARSYLSIYEERGHSVNQTLLTFAKLDFNLLQQVHQKELSEITRWWKDLDFVNKLPFIRNRVVECYFWALGVFFEPEHYFARRIFYKAIAMITTIDDIYDAYGIYAELELFTKAVERWDISVMDQLSEYMKVCYQAMLDEHIEIEEKLTKEGKLYGIHYATEAITYGKDCVLISQMKVLVRAYFEKAKWLHQNYTPKMDEYMSVALTTSYFLLSVVSFAGMADIVIKDSLDWIFNDSKSFHALLLLGRLMDDMKSHKVRTYTNIYKRIYTKRTYCIGCGMLHDLTWCHRRRNNTRIHQTGDDAWKDINEEWLIPTIPRPLLLRILNLARANVVIYKYEDGFTHAELVLKDSIVPLFVDPVPI